MALEVARTYLDAVARGDFEAAARLLAPDVETVTPRGSVRGTAQWRAFIENATRGSAGVDVTWTRSRDPERDAGDVVARVHGLGRWRESGEPAFEADVEVRLTIVGGLIVRTVSTPAARPPADR